MNEGTEARFFDDAIVRFLDDAIASQQAALRFHFLLACAAVGLGITMILGSYWLMPDHLKWPGTLGGSFLPTLSSFPVKEVFTKRDRISGLVFLRDTFLGHDRLAGGVADEEHLSRLQEQFWELLKGALAVH